MFVTKAEIKALLVDRGLLTASRFNDRCSKKQWHASQFRKCYDTIIGHFGIDTKLNRNYVRSLVRLLNGDEEGTEFVSSKRSRMDMSYEEDDEDTPLLDPNQAADMSFEEEIDPVLAQKDRLIEGIVFVVVSCFESSSLF